jgi:hypothetical protein
MTETVISDNKSFLQESVESALATASAGIHGVAGERPGLNIRPPYEWRGASDCVSVYFAALVRLAGVTDYCECVILQIGFACSRFAHGDEVT